MGGTWANQLHLGWQASMRDAQHARAIGQQLAEGRSHGCNSCSEMIPYNLLARHALFRQT